MGSRQGVARQHNGNVTNEYAFDGMINAILSKSRFDNYIDRHASKFAVRGFVFENAARSQAR